MNERFISEGVFGDKAWVVIIYLFIIGTQTDYSQIQLQLDTENKILQISTSLKKY
jgi:hypothetical protein